MRRLKAGKLGRRWAALLLACCGLALLGASAASARPAPGAAGELDSSFGGDGKVTVGFPAGDTGSLKPKYVLPFEFTPGHLEMARSVGGKVVVAGASKIVRVLPNGKLDPSFGSGGTVAVPPLTGQSFVLAGVAVDRLGRVLLAGLSRPLSTTSTPDPVLSQATVMRFNPDGTLDPTFANGGVLISSLGFLPPKAAGGAYPGDSIGLRDIAVDAQNRPVLTGSTVTEVGGCNSTVDAIGFVARLTEAGALDTSFGENGRRTITNLATLGQVELSKSEVLTVGSSEPTCGGRQGPSSLLTAFDGNGNLAYRFGASGFRRLSFDYAPTVSITPSNKILLLGRPYDIRVGKKEHRHTKRLQTVIRLLSNGAADPGFRRTGLVSVVLPKHGSLAALTADGRERIIVAGRLSKRVSKSAKNTARRSTFLVSRLTPNGAIDSSFGTKGTVVTGFGGPTDSFATQVVLASRGRILVGGGVSGPGFGSGGGFAIARYLGGD